MECIDCGGHTNTYYSSIGPLCDACRKKRREERVLEKSESVKEPSDFKDWDSGDMSELFWIHLGRYIKEPNPTSLTFIELAYRWACHDSHGLANSFKHAMDWAKIDLYAEELRWRKMREKEGAL